MTDAVFDRYIFTTDESNPRQVVRIQLEMVDFTLNVSVNSGETDLITDPDQVQSILDRAREFNRNTNQPKSDSAVVKTNGGVIIEVKLDPVNPVNAFHIPA